MEFTDLNQENLVNISFTDVMKIVSLDTTTTEQKMMYIYLLNVIMDTNERIDELQRKLNIKDENEYED